MTSKPDLGELPLAVLIYPKPEIGLPVTGCLVWLALALLEVGLLRNVRLARKSAVRWSIRERRRISNPSQSTKARGLTPTWEMCN